MRINLSENTVQFLAALDMKLEEMQTLMQDVALGREILNAEGKKISSTDANALILDFSRKVLCIDNPKDRKQVRRGLKAHGREWLDIIEDTVEIVVSTGLSENEWFDEFVDKIQIGYGDRADIVAEEETLLSVAKSGESHHDHILQRIAPGETLPIKAYRHTVKVGADINRYIAGQLDWAKFIKAIAKAFIVDTQSESLLALDGAASKLPVTTGFIGTGALSTTTKDQFDDIIANVQAANEGAAIAIFGVKTALKKITPLADVDWANNGQKDNLANTGVIGIYEGTPLVEIPQRFKDKTMTTKMFNSKKLYIMPMVENKLVKFVDVGDTEINEVSEKGEQNGRWDDIMTYEVQRIYGVGVVIGRYFGQWTLPA